MFEQQLILGRYKVIGKAGSGGYATVQHAFDTRLKRDVAIKCIKLSQADIDRARVSAINEGRVADFVPPTSSEPRVRPIGARAMSRAKAPEARSLYGRNRSRSAYVGSGAAILPPERMPIEPGFLELREKAAEQRAIRRSFPTSGMERGSGADQPRSRVVDQHGNNQEAMRNQMGFSARRSSAPSVSDADISALASMLPGKISGAGETAISAVDDAAVDITPEFAAQASREAAALRDNPMMITDMEESSVLAIPSFLSRGTNREPVRSEMQPVQQDSQQSSRNDGGWAEPSGAQNSQPSMGWQEGMDPFRGAYKGPSDNTMHFQAARMQMRKPARVSTNTMRFPVQEMPKEPNMVRSVPQAMQQRQGGVARGNGAPARSANPAPLVLDDNIPGLEEARTAAHLNDANIVTVYDCVVEGDTAYVIMEYVEGKTLAQLLRQLGNEITLDMVATVFDSISHALEVAHKANVLHLDIKPENVIVNADGVVKVTDFGLSALMDAGGHGSTGGGTIGYMPLEQMRQQPLDVRTDEWALASLTYEMLSGANPFRARTLKEAEEVIEEAELVLPSLCWDEMDESVDDVMFSALDPDMDERYDSIEAFSQDLAPYLGDAKQGGKQLAAAVKESEAGEEQEEKPVHKALAPLIDRIGTKGSSLIMRILSALGCLSIALVAIMNIRPGVTDMTAASPDTTFGLFSIMPLVGWALMLGSIIVGAVKPKIGILVAYALLVVMLVFNQAWTTALLIIAACVIWWRFIGLYDDSSCTIALTQPLLGAIGLASVTPVLCGALTDVKDSVSTAAFAALSAIVFASLGSGILPNWEIYANFVIALNPAIASASITNGLGETFLSVQTWTTALSWVLAAGAYSLICRKGTKAFDIIGSVVCAVVLIAGTFALPLAMGNTTVLEPLYIFGTFVPVVVAILLAVFGVTDRVRLADGEW